MHVAEAWQQRKRDMKLLRGMLLLLVRQRLIVAPSYEARGCRYAEPGGQLKRYLKEGVGCRCEYLVIGVKLCADGADGKFPRRVP